MFYVNKCSYKFRQIHRKTQNCENTFLKNINRLQLWYSLTLLTLSWRKPLSYRNQPIDLQSKSMNWFLCAASVMKELNPFVAMIVRVKNSNIFTHLFNLIRDFQGRSSLPNLWFNFLSSHIQSFFSRIIVKKFFVRNKLKGTLWFEMS